MPRRGRCTTTRASSCVVNRIVNFGIRLLFRHGYNDTTNAFKAYRREVIENVQPLLSNHFNLTVELPLKAIIRGHSYAIVPISWTNRAAGESKLGLREMGSPLLVHRAARLPRAPPDAAATTAAPATTTTARPRAGPWRPRVTGRLRRRARTSDGVR